MEIECVPEKLNVVLVTYFSCRDHDLPIHYF